MEKKYHELCLLQGRLRRLRHRIIESRISGLGIHPSQHFLLMHLSEMGRFPSQNQIARQLHVSPASIARTLKNLEASGYIQRFDSSDDGRRNEIAITEKGEAVVCRSREIFCGIDSSQYAGFDMQEMEQLHSMLEKQLLNLQQLDRQDKQNSQEEMNGN